MSITSSKVSITQYNVQGKLNSQIIDTIADGLTKYTIADIDQQVLEKAVGWTSFDKPFQPDFSGSSFVYGNYFVFSLRIDKKNIAAKVLKKHYSIEATRRMSESGRDYLSKTEKNWLKIMSKTHCVCEFRQLLIFMMWSGTLKNPVCGFFPI